MRTDDEGHRYEGECSRRNRRKVAIDSENCRDRGERGARIPRLYKNTKTFYKPERYSCTDVSRYEGEKDGECRKRELQRVNAWVVEVREDGMRCIGLVEERRVCDGDTF